MRRILPGLLAGLFAAVVAEGAEFRSISVPSACMGKKVPATVIVPRGYDAADAATKYPVVYLLHGASDSERHIRDYASFLTDADRYRMIVVCPRATFSWWCDSPVDPKWKYETFMTKELVPFIDANFRTIPEKRKRALCGNSMGGQGSLRLALRHPDLFGAIGSIFGAVDFWHTRTWGRWELKERFGDPDTPEGERNWKSLTALAEVAKLPKAEGSQPIEMCFACGYDDFFIEPNRRMHALLKEKGYRHEYYESQGRHDMDFARKYYPVMFAFIDRAFRQAPFRDLRKMEALGPGAVKPTGWLKDRAIAMKNGYTGHAHEYHKDFALPWTSEFKEPRPPPHCWPYECGAYWLDGLARLAYQLDDPELIALVKARVEPVLSEITTNSIMFYTCMSRTNATDMTTVKKNRFFVRASGQYARGLWAYYQATGDGRVPRAFAYAYNGEPDWLQGGCSVKGVSAIMKAYRECGGERMARMFDALYELGQPRHPEWAWHDYLDFHRDGDLAYLSGHGKGADGWAHNHGVMMCETLGSLAMGTEWTGSDRNLMKSLNWYDTIMGSSRQIHGAVVSDEHFGYTGGLRGTETCVVAGQLWDEVLFLSLTGSGRFADEFERIALNAGPVCTSRDATRHVYMQTPDRIGNAAELRFSDGPGKEASVYQREHFPRCCMAALNRILPLQIQHMWMRCGDGLAAALYGPNTLATELPRSGRVSVVSETAYPFDEKIIMKFDCENAAEFPVYLRIPEWCREPSAAVNAKSVKLVCEDGFAKIVREWKKGDELLLTLPQQVVVERGKDRNRGDRPWAAITLGPLVMSLPLESPDGNENVSAPGLASDYAFDASSLVGETNVLVRSDLVTVSRSPVRPGFDWPVDAPVKVTLPLVRNDKSVPVTLVPYACARMRRTLFEVITATACWSH